MQLFYTATINSTAPQFTFDKIESKHIVRVLRKKEDDILHITNGNNELFTAKILVANDKKCIVQIIKTEIKKKPWNYYLHIAIAPTKNNDRLEWFLEKATEIGIDEITPIICKHSERKVVKIERLNKVVISAMKQSLKYNLPKLNNATTFKEFIKQDFEGLLTIAHCEETAKNTLKSVLLSQKETQKITILIGPEGDFNSKEIGMALQKQFIPISLGESRLRTETAGVVATHSVAFFNEK